VTIIPKMIEFLNFTSTSAEFSKSMYILTRLVARAVDAIRSLNFICILII
jgi:hypothetical protein